MEPNLEKRNFSLLPQLQHVNVNATLRSAGFSRALNRSTKAYTRRELVRRVASSWVFLCRHSCNRRKKNRVGRKVEKQEGEEEVERRGVRGKTTTEREREKSYIVRKEGGGGRGR